MEPETLSPTPDYVQAQLDAGEVPTLVEVVLNPQEEARSQENRCWNFPHDQPH